MIDRRRFLEEMTRLGLGASLASSLWPLVAGEARAAAGGGLAFTTARHWHPVEGGVQCDLCPRREVLRDGETGFCRVRRNQGGRLVTLGYDRPCVLNLDPIEKNPLAHVRPGATLLAVAHGGCNLRCLYCQNFQFSQRSPLRTRPIPDFDQAGTVARVVRRRLAGLTFTYTEPPTRPEFVGDLAARAVDQGLIVTLCTAGFMRPGPFRRLLEPFSAVTITYKGPSRAFYRKVCGADLPPVLDAMVEVRTEKKWLEVATLVVPTLNDDTRSLETVARWMVRNLGPQTPWHLERFVPMFKLKDLPPTPQATLEKARAIGREAGLEHVYLSNFAPHPGNHTYCAGCGHPVILRLGFKVLENRLEGGRCPRCRKPVPGLWS